TMTVQDILPVELNRSEICRNLIKSPVFGPSRIHVEDFTPVVYTHMRRKSLPLEKHDAGVFYRLQRGQPGRDFQGSLSVTTDRRIIGGLMPQIYSRQVFPDISDKIPAVVGVPAEFTIQVIVNSDLVHRKPLSIGNRSTV